MWQDDLDYRAGWQYMIFQSTHAVDLARFLGGEIERVYADLSVGQGGRFAIACTAHFDSGATGMITLTGSTQIGRVRLKRRAMRGRICVW